jgi:carbamoyl-phosphate synthase large subunit
VAQALRLGVSHEDVHASCAIDPWFLEQLQAIVDLDLQRPPGGAHRRLVGAGEHREPGVGEARRLELAEPRTGC